MSPTWWHDVIQHQISYSKLNTFHSVQQQQLIHRCSDFVRQMRRVFRSWWDTQKKNWREKNKKFKFEGFTSNAPVRIVSSACIFGYRKTFTIKTVRCFVRYEVSKCQIKCEIISLFSVHYRAYMIAHHRRSTSLAEVSIAISLRVFKLFPTDTFMRKFNWAWVCVQLNCSQKILKNHLHDLILRCISINTKRLLAQSQSLKNNILCWCWFWRDIIRVYSGE